MVPGGSRERAFSRLTQCRYNSGMTQPRNVVGEWQTSAPYWEKHAALVRELMQPISDALVREARIGPGQHVLDVAGGTGEPASTVADLIGRDGRVVCTDVV